MKHACWLIPLCILLAGCSAENPQVSSKSYETVGRDPRRDTEAARAQNVKAIALMEEKRWDEAEAVLQNALAEDVTFGPAHNNLGKVYFEKKKLYLAAWEFEYAAKLMPHQAEPPNNIGLVYAATGRWDNALASYDEALAIDPENPAIIGNAAVAHLHLGDTGPEVRKLLGKLILHDSRQEWVAWAQRKLSLLPTSQPAAATH